MSRHRFFLIFIAFAALLPLERMLAAPARGGDGPLLPLQVSETKRFLTTSDGKPFFWLADTGWLLFHRLTPPEVERYLKDRAAKGFTVIQTMIVGTDDEFKVSDSFGGLAFKDGDPNHPNEAFFRHVDAVVAQANSLGLRVAIAPTWANQVRKKGPHKGTRVFDAKRARDDGEFIGRRRSWPAGIANSHRMDALQRHTRALRVMCGTAHQHNLSGFGHAFGCWP